MSMENAERCDYLLEEISTIWNKIRSDSDIFSDFELTNFQHNLEVVYTDVRTLSDIQRSRK